MAKSYNTLKTALQTKLTALKGQDLTALFGGVYLVNETNPAGYPSAFIMEKAGGGSVLDTCRNEREWEFDIQIFHEVATTSPENAIDSVQDALDRAIVSFDEDPQLLDENSSPQCQQVRVIGVDVDHGIRETGFVVAVLTVVIVDIVDRFSS